MSPNHPRLRRIAANAARDPLRSPLFHWLHANHARLAPTLVGRRIDWRPLIAVAVQAGVTNAAGRAPTEFAMWRTWRNVCAVVAAEQAKASERDNPASTSRARHPRDLPPTARPPAASTPPSLPSLSPSPTPAPGTGRFERPSAFATNAKAIVNAKNPTGDELLQGLRRVLDEASGRR